MCMVSNIGDQWGRHFHDRYPHWPNPPYAPMPAPPNPWYNPPATKEDIEKLRKEMEELKKLLKAAKKFDESTGQPHCEVDAKVAMIKSVAATVGVDMGDLFELNK